ncbi:MAG: DUF1351 domain-containing protein [Clostridia bacterium]|nr:DUF1351 domain-containing protein [Clostridia bacterium]
MKKQICILTKSYKHGGYCVAGVDIETKEWIRLVNSDNPSTDEIRKEQMILNGKVIDCLDALEYDFIKNIPNSCQTENWLLNNTISPRFIKSISLEELADIVELEKEEVFIRNTSNLLNEEEVSGVKRSLYIFHVQNLKIEATSYERFGEIRFRYKCAFDYNGNKYTNISLTDPIYRDISQDGLNLEDALIIASLPCVPYSDGSFYKFVAKIIPVDKNLASYMEKKNEERVETIDAHKTQLLPSPFVKYDLVVQAQQTPGVVRFENYEQLKSSISNGVSYYSNFEYTLDNYQLALKHHNELKHVKSALEKTKREIVKSYNAPLETVEKRIEELINLIKVPFKKLDTFIKQNEKESKKYEILKFARTCATSNGLCEHLDNIINSPAFFDSKWLNASCVRSTWRSAVLLKIGNAVKDIEYILSLQNDNVASILAHYYQTLSIDMVKEFIDSLQRASQFTTKHEKEDKVNNTVVSETQPASKEKLAIGENIEETQSNSNSDINYSDYEILSYVASSINPYTGEVITGIDDYLKNKIIEIANKFENALRGVSAPSIEKKSELKTKQQRDEKFPMAWEKWTEEEESRLVKEFNQGLSVDEIASMHNRKEGGIRARLKKLGLIE